MTRSALRALLPLSVLLLPACGDDAYSEVGASASDTSALSGGDSGAEGGDPGGEGGGEGGGQGGEGGEPGQLTAGEWRDLDHWDFWLGLLSKPELAAYQDTWRFFTTQRFPVVVTSDGVPLADASVTLLGAEDQPLWRARTDIHGQAELFASLYQDEGQGPFAIQVDSSSDQKIVDDARPGATKTLVDLPGAQPPPALDLMFVIDTTGSMGDELEYIQTELADVISRVKEQVGPDVLLRLSVNFYRDQGDAYVVRPFPFTTDIDQAITDLGAQSFDGGGDTPEAVEAGLADAIDAHDWSESAAARLCFLVLDAPPHQDEQALPSIQDSVRSFAAKGVRLIPLAASGVDQSTEFMLRFYAISTGATYTFLTDHSGIGAPHLEPTIGDYDVELLNDLMVRLISEALTP